MKIFNWVQRRFTHKDGMAQNTKQSGLIINADEAAYENNDFPNMFDGWKGGLLAIGTFGYDPMKDNEVKQDEEPEMESLENEQMMIVGSEEEEEEEEEDPLVFATSYEHDYVGLLGGGDESKKERTTLAELFSADSKRETKVKENKRNGYKHGFSLAKKLIGDKEAKPIHKLQRLVRRMMKRKIHPDEGSVEKQEYHTKVASSKVDSSKVVLKKCQTTNESTSLLSTQVII